MNIFPFISFRANQARRMMVFLALPLMLVTAWMPRALAVTPETGLYNDSGVPGIGYYIEVQGTTLVFVAFAHDKETGKPLFYTASGPITKAKPGYSSIFTPNAELHYEYPYQFEGDLYEYSGGLCITCGADDTGVHAVPKVAGHVTMRMVDVNNIYMVFTMNDGSESIHAPKHDGFGRIGYDVGLPHDMLLPSFLGTWVFADLMDHQIAPWLLNFDRVDGPFDDGKIYFGIPAPSHATVRFTDTATGTVQTCILYGCGTKSLDGAMVYTKFPDIGMDHVLSYKGDRLSRFNEDISYRSEHLISGIRIPDPVPDAPPPPDAEQE